jgi:hypothetical protein
MMLLQRFMTMGSDCLLVLCLSFRNMISSDGFGLKFKNIALPDTDVAKVQEHGTT